MFDVEAGSSAAAMSLAIMVGGLVLIAASAWLEHATGRRNPVMMLLDWLWKD